MKKAVFLMEPFSCPSCVKKIENALVKAKGVQQVKVLFHSDKVRIQFDDAVVSAGELQELVKSSGIPCSVKRSHKRRDLHECQTNRTNHRHLSDTSWNCNSFSQCRMA